MALGRSHLGENIATANTVSVSISPPANRVLIATIVSRRNGNAAPAHTCSGGVTWTQVVTGALTVANGVRLSVWRAPSGAGGTFTVTGSANPTTSVGITIEEYSGAGTSFANFSPAATNAAGDPAATLPTAPLGSSLVHAAFACLGSNAITEPAGYTLILPLISPAGLRGQTSYASTTSASAAWSSTNAESVAALLEIKAAVVSILTADSKSYGWTAQAGRLLKARRIVAARGTYAWAPQNSLAVALAATDMAWSGDSLVWSTGAMQWHPAVVSLPVSSSSYSWTAQAAGLREARRLPAAAASWAWAAQTVQERRTALLPSAAASYGWTARAAGLLETRRLPAAVATYGWAAQTARLLAGRGLIGQAAVQWEWATLQTLPFTTSILIATSRSINWSARPATLGRGRFLSAAQSSYNWAAQTARPWHAFTVACASRSYGWTAQPATLSVARPTGPSDMLWSGDFMLWSSVDMDWNTAKLAADVSAWNWSAQALRLIQPARRLVASASSYGLTLQTTGAPRLTRRLDAAAASSYAWSTPDTLLRRPKLLTAAQASISWSARPNALKVVRQFLPAAAAYAWNAQPAALLQPKRGTSSFAAFSWGAQAVQFRHAALLPSGPASLAWTPQTILLRRAGMLAGAPLSLVWSARTAALTATSSRNVLSWSARTAGLQRLAHLPATAATLTWQAQAANLARALRPAIAAASFTWTASDANLLRTGQRAADAATFVWTAQAAALLHGQQILAAAPAALAWTALAAGRFQSRILQGAPGSLTWNAPPAAVARSLRLPSAQGAYAWTAGQALLLAAGSKALLASASLLAWTAQPASLRRIAIVLPTASSAYAWTAAAAAMLRGQRQSSAVSSLAWTAQPAVLRRGRAVLVQPVAYGWLAPATALRFSRIQHSAASTWTWQPVEAGDGLYGQVAASDVALWSWQPQAASFQRSQRRIPAATCLWAWDARSSQLFGVPLLPDALVDAAWLDDAIVSGTLEPDGIIGEW